MDILGIKDIETQQRLLQALDLAKAQAEPYFREIITIAQDEITRALGVEKADFASKQRDLQERIRQIQEDLRIGRGRLLVDEQAELARQQRRYEYQLENLRESAAQAGLTFSTRRALAEARLGIEQQDIVESTKRRFQRQLEDLQTRAARGELEAQNLLADYERRYGERITALGRPKEAYLGTARLPRDLAGYRPLGGVVGQIETKKISDIMERARILRELQNPFV
ncbi:MAG: hypothetical protein DDT22_01024 [candidate division WS2 bacterium]|nr:hypothetical protein [Candidatus Lithacetigena glycinireducens]MBT9175349.1 hypothetical protein [Candidatus Lithacetigena glycinireducens]